MNLLKIFLKGSVIMSNETKRTYIPFNEWKESSKQTEYTERTPLLSPDGELLVKGESKLLISTL